MRRILPARRSRWQSTHASAHAGPNSLGRCARPSPVRGNVPQTPDPDILRQLAGGEIGALGELYDRYREPVRRFVARATSDADDVDDLVHATFLAAAKSAGRYDGRPSPSVPETRGHPTHDPWHPLRRASRPRPSRCPRLGSIAVSRARHCLARRQRWLPLRRPIRLSIFGPRWLRSTSVITTKPLRRSRTSSRSILVMHGRRMRPTCASSRSRGPGTALA